MPKNTKKELAPKQKEELLTILKTRFQKNADRHTDIDWAKVESKLLSSPDKLFSLYQMENTGGEPDVVIYDKKSGEYFFYDCSIESPVGRRSFCYDEAALNSRKENKPKNSALGFAKSIGVEILNEEEYRYLQTLDKFDTKTSSWLKTPDDIRKLGGAIFGDYRYGKVFVYHNGAESYYAARGFRASLRV
jgi:hypothetical protein